LHKFNEKLVDSVKTTEALNALQAVTVLRKETAADEIAGKDYWLSNIQQVHFIKHEVRSAWLL